MSVIRPRRSMLFMPGSNARALEKAKMLSCDGVIFDLEDAVSPDEKIQARTQVQSALQTGGYGSREQVVRINGLDTPWWQDDLEMLVPAAPDAVLVPKIESAQQLKTVEQKLVELGAENTALWAMLETPRAFLRAEEIASASDLLACLVIGTNDLVKDLHGEHTRGRLPVVTALGIALLVARSYGLTALDGVYNDFKDTDGLEAECLQGRQFGFDGKTLIHPSQIGVANTAFGISDETLMQARRLIKAFEEAAIKGKAVAVLDGKMVEHLHVLEAKRQVAMAEATAQLETSF